ncbi:MAG: fructose-1,6-bisphosphatase [Clostridia bacterium]|nr:fructose-1,6-bisphosphatase [Clostridia bacterium]
MENKYLKLLSRDFPTGDIAASEIVNLSAVRSLPKGTEYFFSDIHGEHEAFLHMLKSASGMIRKKVDLALGKAVAASERELLAYLIYYPDRQLKKMQQSGEINDEWRRITIYRLILVCETISAKYTRSRVRKCIPRDMVYILDELLNVTDDIVKEYYYDEIISTVLETGIADRFIKSLCELIQTLAIDSLHIIGDIFDRGPRPDIILDALMRMRDVDIQWGNHDISWMGAASGNLALIANVIRISMRYNNFDVLEDGYGLNLRALAVFAAETYKDDDCALFMPHTLDDNIYDPVDAKLTAKMHKAMTVIQLKLEGQLIARHPEWNMDDRDLFSRVDFARGTVTVCGKAHPLLDTNFPTVDPAAPLSLSTAETELMMVLANSFRHSERLNAHIRFLYSNGSMYKVINGNLLFHGCIPFTDAGELQSVAVSGKAYCGKALLDKLDETANRAYFLAPGAEKEAAADTLWYLWCGAGSPLYGKDKMAFFERYFLDDPALHTETYNPYYQYSEQEEVCRTLLKMFGLDPEKGHIINGHVPVKIKDGERPVKAGGKLFVIDGGISKAYQSATGIAGYTLICDSHSLILAEHRPFISGESEHTPKVSLVERFDRRMNISDTDKGKELLGRIEDLKMLMHAYRAGSIKEHGAQDVR